MASLIQNEYMPTRRIPGLSNSPRTSNNKFRATLCKATFEGEELAQVDIFRVEDGKVVEHWDNYERVPPREEWVNSGKFK